MSKKLKKVISHEGILGKGIRGKVNKKCKGLKGISDVFLVQKGGQSGHG